MEITDVLKKLEIIIDEVDKELYEKDNLLVNIDDKKSEAYIDALADNNWLQGYLKCAEDLKMEIEEELEND